MIRRLLNLHEESIRPAPPTVEIERDSAEYTEVRRIITEKLKQKRERTIEVPPSHSPSH
jgi:hypothetical protein